MGDVAVQGEKERRVNIRRIRKAHLFSPNEPLLQVIHEHQVEAASSTGSSCRCGATSHTRQHKSVPRRALVLTISQAGAGLPTPPIPQPDQQHLEETVTGLAVSSAPPQSWCPQPRTAWAYSLPEVLAALSAHSLQNSTDTWFWCTCRHTPPEASFSATFARLPGRA